MNQIIARRILYFIFSHILIVSSQDPNTILVLSGLIATEMASFIFRCREGTRSMRYHPLAGCWYQTGKWLSWINT